MVTPPLQEFVLETPGPAVAEILTQCPEVQGLLNQALGVLAKIFPTRFSASSELFNDPYDASKSIIVTIDSKLNHLEGERILDDFCREWWHQYMGSGDVQLVFQAGA